MTDETPSRPARPLDGIRVIELGNYIAAPTTGRLLADFGAEVIKVERPRTGDEMRRWRLYEGSTSMLYRTINRNKLSIELDLRGDTGRKTVLQLLGTADVLIENFRPGTLRKWGLGPDVLAKANPDLIVAQISAFGQTGPMADRPGFAAVAEAFGGLRNMIGEPDRPPARTGVSIGDSIAGLYAAFGVTMSLFDRERRRESGQPPLGPAQRTVDVALYEAVFSMMESLVADYTAYSVERERTGGRMEGIAPSNAYNCKDGASIVVAGNADAIFQRLMVTIGRPDLAASAELASNMLRWQAREELDQVIGDWAAQHDRDAALAILDEADVPAGPIYTAKDIIADPQYAARGMVQTVDVTVVDGEPPRPVSFPGVVPLLGSRSYPITDAGPELGEHTAQVLARLAGEQAHGESS